MIPLIFQLNFGIWVKDFHARPSAVDEVSLTKWVHPESNAAGAVAKVTGQRKCTIFDLFIWLITRSAALREVLSNKVAPGRSLKFRCGFDHFIGLYEA